MLCKRLDFASPGQKLLLDQFKSLFYLNRIHHVSCFHSFFNDNWCSGKRSWQKIPRAEMQFCGPCVGLSIRTWAEVKFYLPAALWGSTCRHFCIREVDKCEGSCHRATRMIRRLEGLTCEIRLKDLNIYHLSELWLWDREDNHLQIFAGWNLLRPRKSPGKWMLTVQKGRRGL